MKFAVSEIKDDKPEKHGQKIDEKTSYQPENGNVDSDDSFDFGLDKNLISSSYAKNKSYTMLSSARCTQKLSRATTLRQSEVYTKDSFQIVKSLGSGAYGTVYLVKKKGTENLFAMKELQKHVIASCDKIQSVFRERDILD